MPGKPTNLGLYGATPAEQELSRTEGEIRVTFDLVAGADSYAARLNGAAVAGPFRPGDTVQVGRPNTLALIEVRSEKAGEAPSGWAAFKTVTRPPRPRPPKQLPLELSEFGVVLSWEGVPAFPGSDRSTTTLVRDGTPIAAGLGLEARKIDATYRQGIAHDYAVMVVVPKEAVPGNVLNDRPNVSFPSVPLAVKGPARLMSCRRTLAFLNRLRTVEVTVLRRLVTR